DKVVHFSENSGKFLVHPEGEPTTNVFKLVREELRIELRAALPSVRERKDEFLSKPIPVQFNGHASPVVLRVRSAPESSQAGFVMVMFEEPRIVAALTLPSPSDGQKPDITHDPTNVRILELEAELTLNRQRLQVIIEEYETSQEEMKASNEEMQSTN